jgi:Leucine-rich repeat (LRR) protein
MQFRILVFVLFFYSFLYSQKPIPQSELEKMPTFNSLEKAVANKDQVYKLNLSGQNLKEFPKEILLFENLQELYIAKNQIKELPTEINLLKNLQVLNLSRNKIKKLPPTIGDLSELHTLYISKNRLVYFPNEIRGLHKLRIIDVSKNQLTYDELVFLKKVLPTNCEVITK